MGETLITTHDANRRAMAVAEALFGDDRTIPTLLLWGIFLPTLLVLYLILNWLPLLVAAQGLDRAVAPQASLAFNCASVVGALLVGRMVDQCGPRWPLLACYAGLAAALYALAGSQNLAAVLTWSAAAGFTLMGANYALYGIAPAHYPARGRGTGSGAATSMGRVGSVVGPLLAGMLLDGGASVAGVILHMLPAVAVAGVAAFLLSFHATRH
jgi:AAHS family 3-hydroxyphenylpropionic acid transporter